MDRTVPPGRPHAAYNRKAISFFSFPHPVNEKAARVVAGGVLVLAIVTLATSWYWLLAVIAAGFIARVLTGPKLSPLGRLATGVVAPRLGPPKYVWARPSASRRASAPP